jgi:hypothetical protein
MRCLAVASLAFVVVPLAVAFADLRPRTVAELPGSVSNQEVAIGSRGIGWLWLGRDSDGLIAPAGVPPPPLLWGWGARPRANEADQS